jgi:hypothetical protein
VKLELATYRLTTLHSQPMTLSTFVSRLFTASQMSSLAIGDVILLVMNWKDVRRIVVHGIGYRLLL